MIFLLICQSMLPPYRDSVVNRSPYCDNIVNPQSYKEMIVKVYFCQTIIKLSNSPDYDFYFIFCKAFPHFLFRHMSSYSTIEKLSYHDTLVTLAPYILLSFNRHIVYCTVLCFQNEAPKGHENKVQYFEYFPSANQSTQFDANICTSRNVSALCLEHIIMPDWPNKHNGAAANPAVSVGNMIPPRVFIRQLSVG